MSARKIGYWHCIQNFSKAQLYDEWCKSCPEFLPLKYRPKINPTDPPMVLEKKIEEAATRYRDDIELMYQYALDHEYKVNETDSYMTQAIQDMTDSEACQSHLQNMWREEAAANEQLSRDLWDKRKKFLETKKAEEEEQNNYQTVQQIKPRFNKTKNRANKPGEIAM